VLDYKSPTFQADFRKVGYVDAVFENVGGWILNLILTRLKKNARVARASFSSVLFLPLLPQRPLHLPRRS